ncbi:rhodanese-like domain-containing protein [Streptomyces sp. NPDC046821]|uniref:rhodanese-like domain-containing protein n=1 Tax=Streptomyces sp. NPDC046821 TaxID=3154702 RepID=UPI0033E076A8
MSTSSILSVDEAEPRLADLNVVDVRTPGEFASGHVPGASMFPWNASRAAWRSCGAPRTDGCSWRAPQAPAPSRASPSSPPTG